MTLIFHPAEDSRLGWAEWLVTYQDSEVTIGCPLQYEPGSR